MDGKVIVMSRNLVRPRQIRLQVESLEPRRLFAVAAYQAELFYADESGQIGEPITDGSIVAGDDFYLRITAQEYDPFLWGIGSASINIAWDAALLSVVEDKFQLDSVITADLPLFRTGVLDNRVGTIANLSGSEASALGVGRSIGNARPETFALIRMRAGDEPGQAMIRLTIGDSKTITVPGNVLESEQLRFDVESLTIIPLNDIPFITQESAAPPAISLPVQPPEAEPQSFAPIVDEVIVEETGSISKPSSNNVATEPMTSSSFDLNQDGVFDFADFGLLNVQARQPVVVTGDPEASTTSGMDAPSTPPTAVAEIGEREFHSGALCTFAPRGDAVAFESWLDALATAWLADTEAREFRRRTQLHS